MSHQLDPKQICQKSFEFLSVVIVSLMFKTRSLDIDLSNVHKTCIPGGKSRIKNNKKGVYFVLGH